MRLRRPCEHGIYDDHAGLIYEKPYEHCPGGEFLPEDASVIERIDGEWPEAVLTAVASQIATATKMHRGYDPHALAVALLNVAADQVGEPA